MIAVFVGVVDLVSAPVIEWVHKAPDIGRSIQDKLQVLARPLSGLRDIRDALLPAQSDKGVNVDVVAIVQQPFCMVAGARANADLLRGVVLHVARWRRLRHLVVRYFSHHEARLRSLRIMNDIESNLTGYLSVMAVINAGVGIGAGIIAAVVGLPSPVAWGVLGFVLNFIPYIGAGMVELGMFPGRPGDISVAHARFLAPLLYMLHGSVEGHFSRPAFWAAIHPQSADGVSIAGVLGLVVGAGRRVFGGTAVDRGLVVVERICFPSDEPRLPSSVTGAARAAGLDQGAAGRPADEISRHRPADHRFRAPACAMGGADRIRAGVCGITRLHFAAGAGLGRAGRDGRIDRIRRLEFWPVWIAGALGAACGDWLSYWVGLKLE